MSKMFPFLTCLSPHFFVRGGGGVWAQDNVFFFTSLPSPRLCLLGSVSERESKFETAVPAMSRKIIYYY